jgi:hypothetical protein
MERSKFENIGDPQLRKYARYVSSIIKGEMNLLDDISDFYNFLIYSKTEGSRKIMSPVGGSLTRGDIEYLFYILTYNNLDEEEDLDRPSRVIETVDYVYDERVYRTVRRSGDLETYLPSDLSNGYLFTLKEEGVVDPWLWDPTDTREDDWDIRDEWFNL